MARADADGAVLAVPDRLKLIRKLIAKQIPAAGLTVPVTLVKVATGARDPAAPASGGLSVTTTSYATRGIVADYRQSQIDGTLIQQGDRQVKLLGGLLAKLGVTPEPGDRVVAESETFTIVPEGVSRDAAGAVFTCQVRE